jgi:hypothetical protein
MEFGWGLFKFEGVGVCFWDWDNSTKLRKADDV